MARGIYLKYSARRYNRNIRHLTKRKRPKQRDQEMNEQRRKWPWFRDHRRRSWTLAQGRAKRLFPVNRACPWRFSVSRRPFGSTDHGSGRQRRRSPGPIAARRTRMFARLSRARLFIPPGAAEGSPPHPCPSFQEEQSQLRRRQRPVMRGARLPFHGAITAGAE